MICRFLLPALVLGLAPAPILAQVQVMQTVPAALPSATLTPKAAGDTLLVECDYGSAPAPSGSMKDSAGTQYTALGVNASSSLSQTLSISAPLAAAASVTVTCPGSSTNGGEIYVLELGGAVVLGSAPTFSTSGSGPAMGAILTKPGDLVLAFCVSGTCSPIAGWTTLSAFHSNLVASQVVSGPKASVSFPVTRDWVLTLVAVRPAVTPPLQVTFPGLAGGSGVQATFPIANAAQLPACTAADGVCSIAVQVCDGATPPNCLTGNAGSLSLVKTVSLPTATSTTIPIVLAQPSP